MTRRHQGSLNYTQQNGVGTMVEIFFGKRKHELIQQLEMIPCTVKQNIPRNLTYKNRDW